MTDFNALKLGYDIPARPGMGAADIQTPALIIDMDAFEHNIATLQNQINDMGVRLRAHAKTHKSADVSKIQIAAGAVGICCQKVSEAEALARAGITNILISNEVTDLAKIDRLARLAGEITLAVCVDDITNVAALSAATTHHNTSLDCLVEIEVGAGRCGVKPGPAAVPIAQAIDAAPNLRFAGLQAYNGSAQHIADFKTREQTVAKVITQTAETVALLKQAGLTCDTIAGAGTGTFLLEGASNLFNELQCGSYCFMDAHYNRIQGFGNAPLGGFQNALFVLTSVMSIAANGKAVCDAGLKSMSLESGLPRVYDNDQITYANASDEHGELSDPDNTLHLNDHLRLVPGHCDPTCNLHDWYVCIRNGKVETLWPVTARGKLW
ncbi:MAG: DSD1 family PLP-dependent enzyme [Paracoccaceae bacterium]